MTPIYTKKGDEGYTGILGEGRHLKNHQRFEALGALDEASAALGIARAHAIDSRTKDWILLVQKNLYHLMTEISCEKETADKFRVIDDSQIIWLEERVEEITSIAGSPKDFIVPGEILSSAYISLARAIIRRAERAVVGLSIQGDVFNPFLIRYLNRLSSFCFSLELYENYHHGIMTRKIKDL